MKFSFRKNKRQILSTAALTGFSIVAVASPAMATDMTTTITDWLPTIVSFAMLGMVLGLLKRLGKF